MTRVLATGATGFIGRTMIGALAQAGFAVRTAGRAPVSGFEHAQIGDLSGDVNWRAALADVDAVVHLAGPAHARFEDAELRRAITEATAALAEQAQSAGVQSFVYMSSIKAVAAHTEGAPARERDPPRPVDAYGRAKLDAEAAVRACGGMRTIVLRPPLVHAPDAKANFASLLRIAWSGVPLPFAALDNRRSLISRAALIEAVLAVLKTADGPGGVFHVATVPALSTGEIIAALRRGMGRKTRLFRARALAGLAPRQLRESLEVSDESFRAAYGYGALTNISSGEALAACGAEWKARA